jgi:hypothetical protein
MGKGGGRVLPVLIPFLLTSNSIYLVVVDNRVGCTIQAVYTMRARENLAIVLKSIFVADLFGCKSKTWRQVTCPY